MKQWLIEMEFCASLVKLKGNIYRKRRVAISYRERIHICEYIHIHIPFQFSIVIRPFMMYFPNKWSPLMCTHQCHACCIQQCHACVHTPFLIIIRTEMSVILEAHPPNK